MKPADHQGRPKLQIRKRDDHPVKAPAKEIRIQKQGKTKPVKRRGYGKLLKVFLYSFLLLIFTLGGFVSYTKYVTGKNGDGLHGTLPMILPEMRYGLRADDYIFIENKVQENQFLFDMLRPYHVSYNHTIQLVRRSGAVFDLRKIEPGEPYVIIAHRNDPEYAQFMVYEPGPFSYVLFHLRGEPHVEFVERNVKTIERTAAGVIYTSLWNAMQENGLSVRLFNMMEDALAWAVDFHRVQPGDRFKLMYEEIYIEGEAKDVGRITAAYFETQGKKIYAIYYDHDRYAGFYDPEGRPMRRAFLKAPVQFSRISSRFNLQRRHPVLDRTIPHLGTDFAAPHGTPILALADGVIDRASYSAGNGYYIRMTHDHVYGSQYLHMQNFATGIRNGVRVRQGDVIGYVGSTGLSSGPHVCLRFWKNGQQVDFLSEDLPSPEPLTEEELPGYFAHQDSIRSIIDALPYPRMSEIARQER